MSDEDRVEVLEPEFEVWNHLESGWQMAFDDVNGKLTDGERVFYERLAHLVVEGKAELRLDLTRPEWRKKVAELSLQISDDQIGSLFKGLLSWYASGGDKWLRHFVHLRIASQGIWRANEALERFDVIVALIGGAQSTPEQCKPYLREVIDSFLFGFDAATIALARVSLEQVARQVLLRIGVETESRLRRERPDLESMLMRLRQAGALVDSWAAAQRLRLRGNVVLHEHMYADRFRRQMAVDSIFDLSTVLYELVP